MFVIVLNDQLFMPVVAGHSVNTVCTTLTPTQSKIKDGWVFGYKGINYIPMLKTVGLDNYTHEETKTYPNSGNPLRLTCVVMSVNSTAVYTGDERVPIQRIEIDTGELTVVGPTSNECYCAALTLLQNGGSQTQLLQLYANMVTGVEKSTVWYKWDLNNPDTPPEIITYPNNHLSNLSVNKE